MPRALFTVIDMYMDLRWYSSNYLFTLTLNETVAAEAGVPLTVSVEPLSAGTQPARTRRLRVQL